MSRTVRIVKTPDVLHGEPRIEGTRVGVYQVGTAVRENGWSIDEVCDQFGLDAGQIRAALDYYDGHPELIEVLRKQTEARVRETDDGTAHDHETAPGARDSNVETD